MPRGNAQNPSPHKKPNVGRLSTLTSVRQEMARVYREARHGKISAQEAGRFAFILSVIGKLIEGADLEKRITEVERRISEHATVGD
jgi:hypothetical protein